MLSALPRPEQLVQYAKFLKRRHKISKSDALIVSHAKSGRTWLAVMISSIYHHRYALPETEIIRFDNFHRLNRRIPNVAFTHDNRKDAAHSPVLDRADLVGQRVVLLVRDPRDVVVSSYFQKLRNRGETGAELPPLFDYVVDQKLPQVLTFLRRWADQLDAPKDVLVTRYEDLRATPASELAKVMTFLDGKAPTSDELGSAVNFTSFDSLRQKEASGFFATDRLRPGDPANPNSFKVRRGKVGGYRDYFTPEQQGEIDAMIAESDLECFGYFAGNDPDVGNVPIDANAGLAVKPA